MISTASGQLVEVVLPLPLHASFTYRIPPGMTPAPSVGHRVVVPFGRKKFYTGIVTSFPQKAPEGMEVKDVALTLDASPVVRHPQMKLWEWLADYYLCAVGDVYKAAVPSGLKIESETFVELNPDYDWEEMPPSGDTQALIHQLLAKEGHLTVAEIVARLDRRGTNAELNRMIASGAVIVSEKLVERYRTRRVAYVRFAGGRDGVAAAFAAAKGAPKQERLLLALAELSGAQRAGSEVREVSRADLLERSGVTAPILKALEKKGVVEIYKKEVNRFRYDGLSGGELPELSPAQKEALAAINLSWHEKDTVLLHGVTSSGKTEIYMHLIDYVLRQGNQALMLVPEIALTTQLTRRLQSVFGSKVVIYHSKFSDNERVDIWKKLLASTEPCVVIGARSAVFLPFAKLGLVIVDEEHESSYKQFDPAPRYNGRDAAMVLASMHGAKTLLGSATPAVETYWKALNGKFGLVELTERYGRNVRMPSMHIVDMKAARKSKTVRGALAMTTIEAARHSLRDGRQVIFFQNRRGFAPIARCRQCAWTPKCDNCDVALVYHRNFNQLRCHYCGAVYPLPNVCPQCNEPAIEVLGYGTERVEDEITEIFPEAKVMRMDLDTTRNKDSYEHIIDDFSAGRADILVGTQMVTKGLDFQGVRTVCVVSADSVLNYPDFRSGERAFNMLEQVAGRAGRRDGEPGSVLIQTYDPAHPVLSYVVAHNYRGFYEREIAERQRYFYPPFCRVIYLYLKHRDPAALRLVADTYARTLRELLGQRVFGPEEPGVARVQNLYIRRIMLKIEPTAPMRQLKELLRATYLRMHTLPSMKGTILYYDVDPQ